MKEITREMIKTFKINKLGYDFMGYTFKRTGDLSFHHLIIPHAECKLYGIGDGYQFWNGAILVQNTSHDYLHIIQRIEPKMFDAITSEMVDENMLRSIEIANLKYIREILLEFEHKHIHDTNGKGKLLIKPNYITNRIKL